MTTFDYIPGTLSDPSPSLFHSNPHSIPGGNQELAHGINDKAHELAEVIPEHLQSSAKRLAFPPSYVIVGVYRLCTDKTLYVPAWDKCRHATQRGAIVGVIWATLTFGVQRKFVELFLMNTPRIAGLSTTTIFGYTPPFSPATYATVLLIGSQITYILKFFLARNLKITRERVWAQSCNSRAVQRASDAGKALNITNANEIVDDGFWWPYVEEWDHPPRLGEDAIKGGVIDRWVGNFAVRMVIKRVLLLPFNFYPFVGMAVSAWLKSLATAKALHQQYFKSKKMTPRESALFVEERKWDYRVFGFVAALVEGLPIIGILFNVSNRIGAAMWAHDLEKRQHFVASQKRK